jgi:CheY-like chemotaxis protein
MNGFDVARAIRANPAGGKIHLLALTGYGRESDRADALSAGFDGFLVKPVRMEEMREVLERVGKTEDPELADS